MMMKGFVLLYVLALLCTGCNETPVHVNKKPHTSVWYHRSPRIDLYITKYREDGRAKLLWEKSKPYLWYIRSVFKKHGLPNELCLLPMVESSFNPNAKNSRAAGLWQFVRSTAIEMGLKVNNSIDERMDWKKSTHAAARYFKKLSRQFDGDWALVLAAYNTGTGDVIKAIEQQGTTNYWQLRLRQEPMRYVPKFLGLIRILRDIDPVQ